MTVPPAITIPPSPSLPPLDAAQREQLRATTAAVQALIAARGGWLPFDEYLQQVLYAPGLGYYSAGAAKFGAAGDFVTAPEISPLFGACVARQCAPLLGAGADLLELGAGSGALAETLLTSLARLEALPGRYYILEVSADLRERQSARLASLPAALRARVHWLEALPVRPLRAVMLANEVADALPFQCFAVTAGASDGDGPGAHGYLERGVAVDAAGALRWEQRPASAALSQELARLSASLPEPFAAGFRSELCTRLNPWVAGLSAALESGMILLFDYGLGRGELYHPQRDSGTLRCHYRQRAHDDPFLYPGLQDITAWVDFTRLAEAASDAGLEVAGYCTQAAFLLANGIDAELANARDAGARARLAAQARELLMPGEMGETFKVMALTRGLEAPRTGFGLQDLRRLL
ncbi:MAG: SAM-dependent methyltransferase [Steroidobacteraceae bacterium]